MGFSVHTLCVSPIAVEGTCLKHVFFFFKKKGYHDLKCKFCLSWNQQDLWQQASTFIMRVVRKLNSLSLMSRVTLDRSPLPHPSKWVR